MSRLLLVSNRLPVTLSTARGRIRVEPSVGGLATALREPHRRSHGLWIGWPGPGAGLESSDQDELKALLARHGAVPILLSDAEVDAFYGSYANGVLWPLFHYQPGQVPLRVEGWEAYRTVNERFADAVVQHYRAGDRIWVHDYQLLMVPALVRRRLPDARIGFFLHIPFPSSEIFATLPNREELLCGMLGADLIGFHTATYQRHFLTSLERLLGLRYANGAVLAETGRRVRIGAFPIGIDAHDFAQRAEADAVAVELSALRRDNACRLLVGIDRLDYTKGIPRRLLAFEELLTGWPDLRGRVQLIQVAVPSRTGVRAYRQLRQEVDRLVGQINGTFGTTRWTPVQYLYRQLPDAEMLALYRAADVMVVTPIRDGMNLVAKEFVACRADEDGVLLLSEFAGAAEELDGAVIVNPYDLRQTAGHMHAALSMPQAERQTRMRALRARVFDNDVHEWTQTFLRALSGNTPLAPTVPPARMPRDDSRVAPRRFITVTP